MAEIMGAELLVKCLIKEGVRYVFGVPGDQCNPITDAIHRLGRDAGLEFVMTRHEQAAAHMADAWARITGQPGVCLATVGPGVADLVPGVYPAYADSIPLIVLGAQNQTWRSYPEHGSMQALDQISLMTPITKWRALVNCGRRIPHLTQWAFRAALSGRPGPAYLDLPSNVLCELVDEDEYPPLPPDHYRALKPPAGDPDLIAQAADMLANADRPLLHAGGGVLRSAAWQEFVELAEYLGAAMTTSLGARGVVPEDHPLCLIPSSYGAMGAQAAADVVLLVGGRLGDLDFWGKPPAWGEYGEQKWIQIDISGESLGLNRPVDLGIIGDAKACLRALLTAVKERTPRRQEWAEIADAREATEGWLSSYRELGQCDDVPIHPLRLVQEVRDFFPRNAIVSVDGGNTAVWAFYLNRIYEPRTFLWPADSGHLGTGVPYAIAAKLAAKTPGNPDVPVYCITGDGSFGFNGIEMETARRLNTPIVVIIADDGAWGMIKGGQKLVYDERYIGVDLSPVRYDLFAQSLGCYGERVTEPGQIRPALQRAVDSGLPAVLDVIIDPEANLVPPDLEILDGLWMEGCEIQPR